MKTTLALILVLVSATAQAQTPKPRAVPPTTLRSILLEQLHLMHDREEWFAPAKVAIADLTPEQARWIPGPGQHSVGMLVNHLTLWNARDLAIMNGGHPAEISVNDETFNSFDATNWPATAARFDAVLTAWERAVESADDAKLHKFASTIAHVTTHNSYHIGQMILTRKLQGSWDSSKGVK